MQSFDRSDASTEVLAAFLQRRSVAFIKNKKSKQLTEAALAVEKSDVAQRELSAAQTRITELEALLQDSNESVSRLLEQVDPPASAESGEESLVYL